MKHKFTARKTISVHLEEAEWKWIVLQSDGNVSEWCREQLLADYENGGVQDVREVAEVHVSGGRERYPERISQLDIPVVGETRPGTGKDRTKVCKHNVGKGWRCWQCGGLAVIE